MQNALAASPANSTDEQSQIGPIVSSSAAAFGLAEALILSYPHQCGINFARERAVLCGHVKLSLNLALNS